ncbi:hypothetical protein PIB30_017311 [Stylosanthes scabra]|uniref:PRISE-like Rossmann-fold domain-containing protein n=1 Tax=Stylosanthes scabra TaxID=79078 RepID=A0ABU6S7I8_9FABA|nr:hypothetical protein [Stylosanthes scabra]
MVVQKSKNDEAERGFKSVALVIGVTGIVGNSLAQILPLPNTPGGPWKVYGVARRPQPSWNAVHPIRHIQCDISDPHDAEAKLSLLTDVTHIFYTAWADGPTDAERCDVNGAMLRNVLRAVIPNAPCFRHVSLQTGISHYAESFNPLGPKFHEPPMTEDMPRSGKPHFYHTQEDILMEETAKKEGVTWSTDISYIKRCETSYPNYFQPNPTGWYGNLTIWLHADLIAEQYIWAAVDDHPSAKNEAFNCSNGDVFKWKHLWKVLAEQFGIEEYGYEEGSEVRLSEIMRDKGPVWDQIVRENQLQPTKIEDVCRSWFSDAMLTIALPLDNMNKAKEHGFLGYRNTKNSFIYLINKTKANKIVP